jgi:hypothetical protein
MRSESETSDKLGINLAKYCTKPRTRVDDILVWGENDEKHDCRVRQMPQRCRQMNFKLNEFEI